MAGAGQTDLAPTRVGGEEDRKFTISVFTIFMMFWAVLVIIGSFFRGPGQNFVLPWKSGIFFEL